MLSDRVLGRWLSTSSQRSGTVAFAVAWGLASLAATLTLIAVGVGCTWRSFSSPKSMADLNHGASASDPRVNVVQTIAYRHATLLYKQHDYAAAASTLDSLLADPQRSSSERLFLLRQKTLCQQEEYPSASPQSKAAPAAKIQVISSPSSSQDSVDCGPRSLLIVCEQENISANLMHLRQVAGTDAANGGTSLEGLGRAARSVGFQAQGVQMDRDALANLSTPAIAWVDGNHYIALLGIQRSLLGASRDTARIHDPNQTREEVIPLADLLRRSGGVLLTLTPLPHNH